MLQSPHKSRRFVTASVRCLIRWWKAVTFGIEQMDLLFRVQDASYGQCQGLTQASARRQDIADCRSRMRTPEGHVFRIATEVQNSVPLPAMQPPYKQRTPPLSTKSCFAATLPAGGVGESTSGTAA